MRLVIYELEKYEEEFKPHCDVKDCDNRIEDFIGDQENEKPR